MSGVKKRPRYNAISKKQQRRPTPEKEAKKTKIKSGRKTKSEPKKTKKQKGAKE